MSAFSRTLIIYNDLGAPATLIFSFDDQLTQGIYEKYFPTVFRVIRFPAGHQHSSDITYKNQLAFTSPQINEGIIVRAATFEPIGLGQKTTLELQDGIVDFTPAVTGVGDTIQALNSTGEITDIGLGFLGDSAGRRPSTVLVWRDIAHNAGVTAQFTPMLRAYVTSSYQENEILQGAIQTSAIWEKNLATLRGTTAWTFTQDPTTGAYKLVPATMI